MSTKSATHLSRSEDTSISKVQSMRPRDTSMDKLDARLKHMSDHLIQQSPYILAVPTDRPHRLHPYQADNWRKGLPWEAHEEPLQYMSFLARDWDDGVLKAVGGWDNEKGELVLEQATGNTYGGSSGTTTPHHGQGPKKKITLAEYNKNKSTARSSTKNTPKATEDQAVSALVQSLDTVAKDVKTKTDSQSVPSQKRSYDEMSDSKHSIPDSSNGHNIESSSKKSKSTPLRDSTKESKPTIKLPDKLTIPPLLSPTLPQSIEEELKRISSTLDPNKESLKHKKNSSIASSSSVKKSSSQLSSPSVSQNAKLVKGKASVVIQPGVDSKPSFSQNAKMPLASSYSLNTKPNSSTKERPKNNLTRNVEEVAAVQNGTSQKRVVQNGTAQKANAHNETVHNGTNQNGTTHLARKGPAVSLRENKNSEGRLIVKLKYGKGRSKTVERILRLQPRVRKEAPAAELSHGETKGAITAATEMEKQLPIKSQSVHVRSNSKKNINTSQNSDNTNTALGDSVRKITTSDKKRRIEESTANTIIQNSKRQKLSGLDLSQKASTHHHSAKMSQNLTPAEADIRTPQELAQIMTPTPSSVEKANRKEISSVPAVSAIGSGSLLSEEVSAWKAEHARLQMLARTLKHTVDDLAKSKEDAEDKDHAEKLIVATAIESIITYIFAFSAIDEVSKLNNGPRDAKTWHTLISYIHHTNLKISNFPLLHGLCVQLEAVVRSNILAYDFDHKKEQVNGNPSPEATRDGSGHSSESYQKLSKFLQNARVEKQIWAAGVTELSIDDLVYKFPNTWSRKAKVAKTSGSFTIGSLSGDFYLPLSSFSPVVEAGRAAWSILEEWCEQESVKWEAQLEF